MTHKLTQEVSDRIKLQTIIRHKFAERVYQYTLKYCINCMSYPACVLIPVTSTGEVCPYFSGAIKSDED
jgi:hypothetical protein